MRADDWITFTIAEIISQERNALVGGPFGSDLVSKDYVPFGIPVIRGANMGNGRWVSGDFVFVSKDKADSLSANCAKPGDLVFTQRGTIGQVALVPEVGFARYLISQSQMKLSVNPKKVSGLFLFYVFNTAEQQNYIQQNAIRTGVPHTNLGILRNTPIRLPALAKQNSIASVLSALDDKIELNNRINEELEGMAKLLYDYWFVQFDFPITAAQATALRQPKLEGKPYRASGGKMVYNDILKQEIPEGWKDGSLLDIATFTNGIACQKYPADGGKTLRVIKIKDMRAGFTSDSDIVTDKVPAKVKIKNGDLLFSWSASLEVMIWAGGDGALNQHIFKVTSDSHPRSFCYFVLLDYLQHFRMMADLRKTTMGHITIEHLEQSQIVIPDDEIARAFEVAANPISERIVKAHEENQQLTRLRDWLLPMLMNGQVTVG